MLKRTEEQLEWLAARVPDHEFSPKGGRPPVDQRSAIEGIFWILGRVAWARRRLPSPCVKRE